MSFLLDILPTDVLILIVNAWLDNSVKDMCALDVAIANQELRMRYIQAGYYLITKKGFMEQIHIRYNENLMRVYKWKEKRGLDIKRIHLEKYCLRLTHLGKLFPHLQEIKLYNCGIKLHHVLFASLVHLRKLTLDYCNIVVSKELVRTNIEELQISKMGDMYYNDVDKVPNNKESEVYVWIAKCCPEVKVCRMHNCVSYITAMQMLQQWSLLKKWEFAVPYSYNLNQFVWNIDIQLLNHQVSTMRKANLESIAFDICLCNKRDGNAKYFLDILLSCSNVAELRSLVLFINDWPAEYSQRLLQNIPNMHQMKHLTFKGNNNSTFPALVDAALNHCHSLEQFQLIGPLNP